MANKAKPKLPKSVLDMKFMKKTRERIEKEQANTQGHKDLYSNAITDEMRLASGNFVIESSFIFCEDLLDGRLSFKGMNPEIERLMELEDEKNSPSSDMEKDVSDEILAKKMKAFKRTREETDSPSKYTVVKKRK